MLIFNIRREKREEKQKILNIGIAMVIVAIRFIIYALNNPQAGFSWSNSITIGTYLGYVAATVLFITKGLNNKH
ncbi:hypothetical protein [Anaerotignum propionicum]|uniref:hypothetical protein n=1 Tax=Anaerotignum propionicum TaxID=28446 RepID=UPI002897F5B6|nr:hypothetical protein [Anaerotignum propionicum]